MRFTETTTAADIQQTDARPRKRKTRLTRKILAAVREMIEEAGSSEGAKKGWETRKGGRGRKYKSPKVKRDNAGTRGMRALKGWLDREKEGKQGRLRMMKIVADTGRTDGTQVRWHKG